jgi:hypothetical protein
LGKHCRRKKQNSAHEASTSFLRWYEYRTLL